MRLSYVRLGTFSGMALSLRDALSAEFELDDVDLAPIARDLRLAPARLAAVVAARVDRRRPLWNRTGRWPDAVGRALARRGCVRPGVPTLFVQTVVPCPVRPPAPYFVYTDRVAREGLRGDPRFAVASSKAWLEREATFLGRADAVFVSGPSTVVGLVAVYGVPAERVHVVGAGPNTTVPPPALREVCRRLVFVGIDWQRKGGPETLEAFAAVRAEHPGLELEVVGCDPPGPMPEGVVVRGRLPHVALGAVLARCDALVLPSHHEATPIVLIEALLAGLPVVSSTVANIPWIVGAGGQCVPPGDVPALVGAMRSLVAGYPAWSERAVRRSEEMRPVFDWGAVATQIAGRIRASG